MRPKFFGDSYDLVKREIIHGLASAKEWTVHPMYFVFDPEPEPEPGFVDRYIEFLRIDRAVRSTTRKDLDDVATVAGARYLFLDPDTGLWDGKGSPGCAWRKHISVGELVRIANAREHELTLVFDQGYSRNLTNEARRQRAERKLEALRLAQIEHQVTGVNTNQGSQQRCLHSVAYVSHAVFIWISTDEDLLASATQRLLGCSRNRAGKP